MTSASSNNQMILMNSKMNLTQTNSYKMYSKHPFTSFYYAFWFHVNSNTSMSSKISFHSVSSTNKLLLKWPKFTKISAKKEEVSTLQFQILFPEVSSKPWNIWPIQSLLMGWTILQAVKSKANSKITLNINYLKSSILVW